MTSLQFSGQIAIVTGATRGIGAAIAEKLANLGATVYGTATSIEGVHKIQSQSNGLIHGVVLNVNDHEGVQQLFDDVVQKHTKIDILVNNAGITRDQLALRMKESDWADVIETNLSSVFFMTKTAVKHMIKNRYGRIVSITSIVGASGNPGQSNYAAAKAGVAGMTRAIAQEVASRGVTVNCIAPGFIQTDMTNALSEEQAKQLIDKIPMKSLGTAADVASAVAFLASVEARYITGEQLHVNGGLYMG